MEVAVKTPRISLAAVMVFVGVLAIDLAALPAMRRMPDFLARIAFFGALPMAHVLVVCVTIAVMSLARRGEVALSLIAFLLLGGTTLLTYVAMINLAPGFLRTYLADTTGIWDNLTRTSSTMNYFGLGPFRLSSPLIVWAAATPPLLIPALLVAWATRHSRLKLWKGPETEGDQAPSIS